MFLQAWRSRARVVIDRESALPWLLGVANHVLSNSRRASRRYRAALARVMPPDALASDHADAVAAAVDSERRMAELRRAVAELPRHEREVVELCTWSGLDQQAAAVALGVSLGTVEYDVTATAGVGSVTVTVPRSASSGHVIGAGSDVGSVTVTGG